MSTTPPRLPVFHRTAHVFVDESGLARQSPYLVVGALKFGHGHGIVTNELELLRNQADWRSEAHFVEASRVRLHLYREAVDIVVRSDASFRCVVLDTCEHDPFQSDRPAWKSHAQLTISLLTQTVNPGEVISATLDHLTVPTDVNYEAYVRVAVNRQLGRLAVATACRVDSRACSALQLADILTGAVAHQYRQRVGDRSAKPGSPKGQLAAHVAERFNVDTLCEARTPRFVVDEWKAPAGRTHRERPLAVVRDQSA